MQRLLLEKRIMGNHPLLISVCMNAVFILLSIISGDLLDVSCLCFEVICPFYAAVAIGEWGMFKSDKNYDIITAQCQSVFRWVLCRFAFLFCVIIFWAGTAMAAVWIIRGEMPLGEMMLLYITPALFLSSFSVLCSLLFSAEHMAAMICGIFWLLVMMLQSLLRIPYVEYVYLFIRFAGDRNGIWVVNKGVLGVLALVIWGVIYLVCRKRYL